MHGIGLDLPKLPDTEDVDAIVKAFASNSAFRAAEEHERTTEVNPFRRPVRPADLEWLNYGTPLVAENVLNLSGLLGHRMLRNIYDTDLLYVPPVATEPASADGTAFYSVCNRVYSALAEPILERHLFTFLDAEREPLENSDRVGLKAHVREYYQRRVANPGRVFDIALSTRDRKESATFLLLQLTAFVPAWHAAVGRNALGDYDLAHPWLRRLLLDDYSSWVSGSTMYGTLLASADLKPVTAAYWQFYLNSSLARGNYLLFLATNHERFLAFLGAFLHKKIDEEVTRKRFAAVLADGLDADTRYFQRSVALSEDELDRFVDVLVTPLVEKFGRSVVEEIHSGFAGAAYLSELWDRDLSEQIAWADRIEEYQDKADKIDHHIAQENIEVDLDTFVESCEETSTTHVHDEHRLVMIEEGQMHFWNNVGRKIELNTGDKLLIPMSRLHGSTVLFGECTYHQPIIPEEMMRQFG